MTNHTDEAAKTLLWAAERLLRFENSRERPDDSDYSRLLRYEQDWLHHTEMLADATHGMRRALNIEPYEAGGEVYR